MEGKIPLEERVAVLRAEKLDEYKLTRIAELRDRQDNNLLNAKRENEELEQEIKKVTEMTSLPTHVGYTPKVSTGLYGMTTTLGGGGYTFANVAI